MHNGAWNGRSETQHGVMLFGHDESITDATRFTGSIDPEALVAQDYFRMRRHPTGGAGSTIRLLLTET